MLVLHFNFFPPLSFEEATEKAVVVRVCRCIHTLKRPRYTGQGHEQKNTTLGIRQYGSMGL